MKWVLKQIHQIIGCIYHRNIWKCHEDCFFILYVYNWTVCASIHNIGTRSARGRVILPLFCFFNERQWSVAVTLEVNSHKVDREKKEMKMKVIHFVTGITMWSVHKWSSIFEVFRIHFPPRILMGNTKGKKYIVLGSKSCTRYFDSFDTLKGQFWERNYTIW